MHEELLKNSSKQRHKRESAQQQQIHNSVDAVNAVDTKDSKRTKYNTRYNAMIEKFEEWKPIIVASSSSDANNDGTTTGSSRSSQRRFQILLGCFAGSDNPAVLEALRVIYVEYGALRVSGDWIYTVVSALMKPIVQRYHNQNQ